MVYYYIMIYDVVVFIIFNITKYDFDISCTTLIDY